MEYINMNENHLPDDLLEAAVEAEDKNGFDFTKLLTSAVQMNCNNNCSRATDDIFAESIRTAFIMAENEEDDHLNNNELLSELASPNNNWLSLLTNGDCEVTNNNSLQNSPESKEDIFEKLSTNFDSFITETTQNIDPLPSISSSFLKTQSDNLENLLTKTSEDVLFSFVSPTLETTSNFSPVQPTHLFEGNYRGNIINICQSNINTCATSVESFDNNTLYNILPQEKSDTIKKPKRKRAASDREKNRTQSVNTAFQKLRTLIPTEPVDRKLSKVETLRLAISYISHLGSTLDAETDDEQPCMRKYARYSWENENNVCTFCMSNTKMTTNR